MSKPKTFFMLFHDKKNTLKPRAIKARTLDEALKKVGNKRPLTIDTFDSKKN